MVQEKVQKGSCCVVGGIDREKGVDKLQLRPSQDRGVGEQAGWLQSHHRFSFVDYLYPRSLKW